MTRLILWALNPIFFTLMVILAVGLQSGIFADYPLNLLQPNIVLLAVIWCALKRGFFEGGVLTLLFAYVAELHSASPQGIFLIIYMAIYLLLRLSIAVLVVQTQGTLVGLTLAISALEKLVLILLFRTLFIPLGDWKEHLFSGVMGALVNASLGAWVFRALERFDWVTFKNAKARQLLENDLYISGEGL